MEKRIVNKLTFLMFCLIIFLVHILVFNVALGRPLTFSYAAELMTFKQAIVAPNPVEEISSLKTEDKKVPDLSSSSYRLVTPLGNASEKKTPPENQRVTIGPVATFSGAALYPNSQVFLDVRSQRFFSSTLSDNQGRWTWTNAGHPLEPGEHSLEAYSIAPIEVAGKKDILAQKYFFTVAEGSGQNANFVSLGNSNYAEKGGGDDLGERVNAGRLRSTYLFNVALPDKNRYNPGDDLNVELLFSPLAENTSDRAVINYAIYAIDNIGIGEEKPIAQFSDEASLDNGGYFLKNIKLKEDAMPGDYILKITARIGADDYFQAVKFNLNPKTLMTVGTKSITVEKFGQVVVFNVILILLIMIIITGTLVLEFRRFMVYGGIDGRVLRRKRFISK